MNSVNEILKCDTLLSNIVLDLLPIIKEYIRIFPIFAIGKYSGSYDDYRLITRNDFDDKNFFETFKKYYYDNVGLLSLDDFDGAVLCGENFSILIEDYYVRCTKSSIFRKNDFHFIEKGTVIKFRTSIHDSNESFWKFSYIRNSIEIYPYSYPVGLFVRKDIKF